ncbi:MAG: hypothetical protein AAFV72_00395 [Cyanobacteria bacterium J06635_1]
MKEISIPKDTDLDWARVEYFQKASFICKKKPRNKALVEQILGTIRQNRKKYWVVAKPGRQIGDKPKVSKRFELPEDLCDWLKTQAEHEACYQVDIVVRALNVEREKLAAKVG